MPVEWMPVGEDVLEIVQRTIASYERHSSLLDANICVMFRMGEIPKSKGLEVWGRAEKFPDKWNAILRDVADVEYDFLVWFTYKLWITFDNNGKEAAVFHELCHCEMEWSETADDYVAKIVGHDIELFVDEYRYFGAWRPGLPEIENALRARQERLPGIEPTGTVGTLSVSETPTIQFNDGPVLEFDVLVEALQQGSE